MPWRVFSLLLCLCVTAAGAANAKRCECNQFNNPIFSFDWDDRSSYCDGYDTCSSPVPGSLCESWGCRTDCLAPLPGQPGYEVVGSARCTLVCPGDGLPGFPYTP